MHKPEEIEWIKKASRAPKQKKVDYYGNQGKFLSRFAFSLLNKYMAQGRTISDFSTEQLKNGATFRFLAPVKHPCLISRPQKRTALYELSDEKNLAQAPDVMKEVVRVINENRDKTGLPTTLDWQLRSRKDGNGYCAVLEIEHHLVLTNDANSHPDTEPFMDILRAVRLFCEQYADINHGRVQQVYPQARYEILGATPEQHQDKTPKRVRIIIPIPAYMKSEDLQVVFEGCRYHWLRLSTCSTIATLPLDYCPDEDPDLEVKLKEIQSNSTRHLSATPDNADAIASAKPMLADFACAEDKTKYAYFTEAFDAYQIEWVDIAVAKKILLKSPSLAANSELLQKSAVGICAKIPEGERGNKIFYEVFSSAQVAGLLPTRQGAEWTVRAGMIICKIDKISDAEKIRFMDLCACYPAKVFMRGDDQLVIMDKLLKQQDIMAIGAILADEGNSNANSFVLLKDAQGVGKN